MKKTLSLILAAVMLLLTFSCFGCSNDKDDVAYVTKKGTLIVGITDFAPMDYQNEKGEWIGFDADYAKAFAESLGVKVEFIEIEWGNKENELNSKSIDCVWNGMTLTDGVKEAMETSKAYCLNAQVVVLSADKADKYKSVDDIKDLKFAVEDGSAGQEVLEELKITGITKLETQSAALMEVAAGTSDACVIDLLMANAMVGEGTSYPNHTYTVKLNSEEYGVGFRKGSALAAKLNEFMKTYQDNGKLAKLAETYKINSESVIAQ
ncbi:MAG: transporter substrate-binding domain-containing protein [Clostridia bacterium]|nr:transporter substrate-binding domain-containing protein [Clostridia bacterium]